MATHPDEPDAVGQGAPSNSEEIRPKTPAERIRRAQRRVASGFYDNPRVLRETARRIIEAGDLPK